MNHELQIKQELCDWTIICDLTSFCEIFEQWLISDCVGKDAILEVVKLGEEIRREKSQVIWEFGTYLGNFVFVFLLFMAHVNLVLK